MASNTIHTTISILKAEVPASYRSAVEKLRTKLMQDGTIQTNDTPFDIDLIQKHIGSFEHGWVKNRTFCHFKGEVPTATATPAPAATESIPVENQNLAATTTVAPPANKRPTVIGGKKVPPVDPNGLLTESASSTIQVNKEGPRYLLAVHVPLSKMQQTVLLNFIDTIDQNHPAYNQLKLLADHGKLAITMVGDEPNAVA